MNKHKISIEEIILEVLGATITIVFYLFGVYSESLSFIGPTFLAAFILLFIFAKIKKITKLQWLTNGAFYTLIALALFIYSYMLI